MQPFMLQQISVLLTEKMRMQQQRRRRRQQPRAFWLASSSSACVISVSVSSWGFDQPHGVAVRNRGLCVQTATGSWPPAVLVQRSAGAGRCHSTMQTEREGARKKSGMHNDKEWKTAEGSAILARMTMTHPLKATTLFFFFLLFYLSFFQTFLPFVSKNFVQTV